MIRNWCLSLLVLFFFGETLPEKSHDPFDIVLLLESSDNFRSQNFEHEKNFAAEVAQLLWRNKNRLGVYTFGSSTHRHVSLNTYNQLSDTLQSINYIWYSTGNGKTEDAILHTVNEAFTEDAGNRDCTPNILVVLAHTGISDVAAARKISEALTNNSISPIIVDMAAGSGDHGFRNITGDGNNVLSCPDFTTLQSLPQKVFERVSGEHYSTGCGVLSEWQSWSRCSVSCGRGLKLRTRTCIKNLETDKDCYGERSQDEPCSLPQCNERLDGGWSNWEKWSKCSATCNKGVQTRHRFCNEPIPKNGGQDCPGSNIETRECATWSCPDCSKSCPPGGKLSTTCEFCECSSTSLIGRVMDNLRYPVEGAKIYLESSLYKPIGTTNEMGYFNVSGTCIMNEIVHAVGEGYADGRVELKEINATHWWANATVIKYVPPVFNITPESKIRMVGQSATFCCSAVGTPTPLVYKWFKDGIEIEHAGANGSLLLDSLKLNDAGKYRCSAETGAGVSQTDEADLLVKEYGSDTCSKPISKLETLPASCFVEGDTTKNSTINIQTCRKERCITSSLNDNGTCSDWWSHHCCDVDQTELVNISCDGFSYQTARVKSCRCQLCVSKTTISGRAFGRSNGKVVPLQLASISANGQQVSSTSMVGYFRFDVPKSSKRVILHFHDGVFKKFLDHTKTILPAEGVDTQLQVVVPLKPQPIPFNPNIGADIQLGGSDKGKPPLSSISIPDSSLITEDGQPYKGQAKATVHYMDPRNRDDMESANGEFVYESPNGEKLPLQTFGMFHMTLEDENGNALKTNKPLKFSLDSSLFNVTLDKDGNPDLALWYFDVNKGIWIEQSKMKFSTSMSGRRKLLDTVLVGDVTLVEIPHMDPYSYKNRTERRIVGYTNCDRSVPIYDDIQVREPTLKDGICFVSVSAYKDFTLKETTGAGSVSITAYSQNLDESAYLGTETRPVDEYGHACLMVFCDKYVYLKAEKDGENLLPAQHSLPMYYPVHNASSVKEIKFESRYFGDAYDCPSGSTCKGPMFPYANGGERSCRSSHSDSSFKFRFAPFTKEPSLSLTLGSTNIYDQKLSWYPVSPDKNTFRSCFIKVQVKVSGAYDLRVVAKSHLATADGDEFGSHNVGPVPKPNSTDYSNRAACIEFRCPGFIRDGSKEIYNLPTVVTGRLLTGDTRMICNMSFNPDLKVTKATDKKGFTFIADAGRNYGPLYGIFINDAEASKVKDFCYSGIDSGPYVDGLMDPDKNPAIVYTCQ